jgi:hypothetical protein
MVNHNTLSDKPTPVSFQLGHYNILPQVTGSLPQDVFAKQEVVRTKQSFQEKAGVFVMSLDFLLIPEYGPVDHNHTFHYFSDPGIQFWVLIFDFIKEAVKITLDLHACVQIFSDLPEVILVPDVGHNHIVLYVCHQIVDKFKVLNVLLGEEFVVHIVAYAVNVLLDKETLSIREGTGTGHLKHADNT